MGGGAGRRGYSSCCDGADGAEYYPLVLVVVVVVSRPLLRWCRWYGVLAGPGGCRRRGYSSSVVMAMVPIIRTTS